MFRGFCRARRALWMSSLISVMLGVAVHDWAARSSGARLLYFAALALSLAYPLEQLLGFRCPRCGNLFLATGGWRAFFSLGRILWSKRCGTCALSIANELSPSSGRLPESRPV